MVATSGTVDPVKDCQENQQLKYTFVQSVEINSNYCLVKNIEQWCWIGAIAKPESNPQVLRGDEGDRRGIWCKNMSPSVGVLTGHESQIPYFVPYSPYWG